MTWEAFSVSTAGFSALLAPSLGPGPRWHAVWSGLRLDHAASGLQRLEDPAPDAGVVVGEDHPDRAHTAQRARARETRAAGASLQVTETDVPCTTADSTSKAARSANARSRMLVRP